MLQPFPPTAPATDLVGMVTQISTGGGTRIPRDGAVLVARGSGASRLAAEAAIGENMLVRLVLRPQLGGRRRCDRRRAVDRPRRAARLPGPGGLQLERQIYRARPAHGRGPAARTGGSSSSSVDGRQHGYSTGVTTFELAQMLVRLGAVTANRAGLRRLEHDGLQRHAPQPTVRSRGRARGRRRALTLFYYGVHRARPVGAGPLSERGRRRTRSSPSASRSSAPRPSPRA